MKNRSLAVLFIAAVACAILGIFLIVSSERQSLTLADLTPNEARPPSAVLTAEFFRRSLDEGWATVVGVEGKVFLYVLAALIVGWLVLRNVFALARLAKRETLTAPPLPAGDDGAASEKTTGVARAAPQPVLASDDPTESVVSLYETARTVARQPQSARRSWEELSEHFSSYAHGVTGRMMATFTALVAAFGLLAALVAYFTLTASLRGHAMEMAKTAATNVSDSAPAYLLKNSSEGLREILRKQAMKPGIAYVLIQDRAGKLFAHSFPVLPAEVQNLPSAGAPGAQERRTLRIGNAVVHEVRVPVLEGRLGGVRVGLWKEEVDAAIAAAVMPLLKWLALTVVAGIFAASFLVWRINRPIVRLVRAAREISHGELDTPGPGVADASEYGELSRALERMRASVRAAMLRLNGEI